MNRKRLQMVRDRIASEPPERLDMAVYSCGTAHCIAGWEKVIDAEERGITHDPEAPIYLIREFLQLTDDQADALFFPSRYDKTKDDALAALDSLINADSDDALPVWPEPRT